MKDQENQQSKTPGQRPLDDWIRDKIDLPGNMALTRKHLEKYQLEKLVETIRMATQNSIFYKERLREIDPDSIEDLEDLKRIPFVTESDLRARGTEMLCVRNAEISRIVTLETSGTTSEPKRIYYTEEDQDLTIDFFHHGMKNLVDSSDVVLILMPCQRPGSVGDLLNTGLHRLGSGTLAYGLLKPECKEMQELLLQMDRKGVTGIVGMPSQVAELARVSSQLSGAAQNDKDWRPMIAKITSRMRSVLLSAEYVSDEACEMIRQAWDCKVFEHYGMTEMGLGGAVSCQTLEGYHPREADLIFEIIDPQTGEVLPDGEYGEVVFTTITRKGMPFIRYRTGDRSRWIPEPCDCGSILKRLDKIGDRKQKKGSLLSTGLL